MKIKTFAIFSVIASGLLCNRLSGQTKLTDLISYSLEHSRDVKKAELQRQEASYLYKEVRGNGLPQIEASASYSKMMLPEIEIPGGADERLGGMLDMIINENVSADTKQGLKDQLTGSLNSLTGLDAMYTASAGIQVTQLIYSQSYWTGLKTARKTKELYSLLKTKTEEDVIAEVASGYYQAGSLMLQLGTIDKSLSNLKEIHRIAELSYQNDLTKETNVNRLKVTISNLQVTRQTIQNGVSIQLNYLKALAGMPADTLLNIDTTAMITDFVDSRNNGSFSVNDVPSYQVLLKQNEVYGQQIKSSQAKYYPTIAAFGQFNFSSYSTSASIEKFSNMNTIGLNLSVPLFTSGVNSSKVKQAKLKQAQLQEDILKTQDLLTVNYNNAYLEYQTSHDLLAAQKENRELAQKVYNQTSMQYQEGVASMADLLNVNSDFLQADNSYNQQVLKCKTSEINILKASGNLKSLVNNK